MFIYNLPVFKALGYLHALEKGDAWLYCLVSAESECQVALQ